VDLPRQRERKEITKIHLLKRKRDPEKFNLELIAKASVGFSGAEIEQAIVSSLFDAFQAENEVDTEMIMNSIRQTKPLSVTMKENIDALRNWAAARTRFASSQGEPEEIPSLGRQLEF